MIRHTWNGAAAKSARIALDLKPDAVAEKLGVDRASVYGWEAGREPQLRNALQLAELYRVPVESFFAHEPEGVTTSDGHDRVDHESPAHANAPVAVVSGAVNAGRHEGALTKE